MTQALLTIFSLMLLPSVLACQPTSDEKAIDETVRAKIPQTDPLLKDFETIPFICAEHQEFDAKVKEGSEIPETDKEPIDELLRENISKFCSRYDAGDSMTLTQLFASVNQTLTENPDLVNAKGGMDFSDFG